MCITASRFSDLSQPFSWLRLPDVGISLLPNVVAHTPTEVRPAALAATTTAADILSDQLLTITSSSSPEPIVDNPAETQRER